jgi:hypothetical protein
MNIPGYESYYIGHLFSSSFSCLPAFKLRATTIILALTCATAIAQIRVTTSGGPDPEANDGSTWEKALSGGELAQRLSNTSLGASGGEYWLAMGVYPPIRPHRGTVILGGFDELDESREERDPEKNQTTLTGVYLSSYEIRTPDYELVEYQVPDRTTVIDGCTLMAGPSSGPLALAFPNDANINGAPLVKNCKIQGSSGYGYGVTVNNGPLRLEDCEIRSSQGGGLFVGNFMGDLDLLRCQVRNNGGAGIRAMSNGRLTVSRSVIEENGKALLGDCCGLSSGIWIEDATVDISHCEIRNNTGWSGAGVRVFMRPTFSGNVVVRDSNISGNQATDQSQGGGGIYTAAYQAGQENRVVITNCVISANTAAGRGGGVYLHGYGNRVIACSITGNHTGRDGGGVFVGISPNTFENSILRAGVRNTIIAGNTAKGNGGGLAIIDTNPQFINCTIDGNSADGNGGAIYNSFGRLVDPFVPERVYLPPLIANSVLTGNSAVEGTIVYHFIGFYGGSLSNAPPAPVLDRSAYPASGTFKRFWQYAPLADIPVPAGNFFVADPGFVDAASRDYRLIPASPLVDRGNDNHVLLGERDRSGAPRIYGSAVDVGAYELGTAPAPITLQWTAGKLLIQFQGRLQWTSSLANPNWEDVSAPNGELEVTPTGTQGFWRVLEEN